MADSLELPVLWVEGDADKHTVIHLMGRHGIVLDRDLGPVLIKPAQNDKAVLDAMSTAVRASTNRSVGFVIDADGPVTDRWRAVGGRLNGIDLVLPETPPPDGWIGESAKLRARVGVWIMPDNTMDTGKLEDLVATLVPPQDALIGYAGTATEQAYALDPRFKLQDRLKAILHCWLAWQPEPGFPFGMALKAHFLRHDSAIALRFVAWFKRLYALD